MSEALLEENRVGRPGRWDAPFDARMTPEVVDHLCTLAPFRDIDPSLFPKQIPYRDILLNDTRLNHYREGDIVVREGDYGNSAFFIVKGTVRVVVPGGEKLPESVTGAAETKKKSWREAISQLWTNSKIPGYRARVKYQNLGEPGSDAALRTDGDEVRVFLQDMPGVLDKYRTIELKAGEFFGEMAALGRIPRSATVIAADPDTVLLEIKWQGLRDIRAHAPAMKEHIDRLYRERSLISHLRETPLLAHLDDATLAKVAEQTQFKTFGTFDGYGSYKKMAERSASNRLDVEPVIVGEGDYAESVILIRSGFTRLSEKSGSGHRTICYFGRGQYYGFREIVHNWQQKDQVPYEFTLRALGVVDVLLIPARVLETHVLPTLPKNLYPWRGFKKDKTGTARSAAKELEEREKDVGNRVATDVLEFMVEHRVMNGTATMLIDLDRCTRCDDCVRACASAHDGNPRFTREGKQVGHWMVTNACMHCQDPVCMVGCPTGAIHRNAASGRILINDLACIGCTVCAESCPYENITMELARNARNEFIVDKDTHRPIMKATKCDLCSEQHGGPACERACPHDAMVRMDMRDYPKLARWFNR